jgi:hypothetical protein
VKDDYPDLRKVDEMYEADYLRAGYKTLATDHDGRSIEVMDEEAFKKRLFDLVTSREADANTKSDMGWTTGELYSKLFTGAPGADGTPVEHLDLNQHTVYAKHLRRLGTLCNAGVTGFVQSRLAEEPPDGDGHRRVLCHGKLTRGYDLVDGFWITRDPTLILSAWDLKVEKWAREANSLRSYGRMILQRQPELAADLSRALKSGETRVRGTLNELAAPNGAASGSTKAIADKSATTE